MPEVPFSQIPDDARVWVFGAARPLSADEQRRVTDHVDAFIHQWAAHGSPVVGGRELRHDRFLLVAADERATGVSGCSIDTLFRTLGDLECEMGVPLRDGGMVFFRDGNGVVQAEPRPAFRKRALSGGVGPDTVVFDNTVTQMGEVRAGRWETPLARAWHARAFPVGQSAGAPGA